MEIEAVEPENVNSEVIVQEEKVEVEQPKVASDVFNFLQNVKLEVYYEPLVENGADKMNQLIYVDDAIIDQLCQSVNMKVIHTGVFKKAIRECRASAKLQSTINKNTSNGFSPDGTKPNVPYTRYEQNSQMNGLQPQPQLQPVEHASALYEARRRHSFNHENSLVYPNARNHVGQIVGIQQSRYENPQFYNRMAAASHLNSVAESLHSSVNTRYVVPIEEPVAPPMTVAVARVEVEPKIPFAPDQMHFTGKQSYIEGFTHHIMADGSYYVTIADRSVKFPPSVRLLTHLDRIDNERREVIRKGSQIFGRDDTKRKSAELAPLEVLMNEIAYEVCLRDFTYMISRQKLLGLVREIVKDNQIQLSTHHSGFTPTPSVSMNNNNSNSNTSRENGRFSLPKSKVNSFYENNVETVAVDPEDNKISSDYDVILFHKVNREWPPGISKERRKYLGRRSSNFEAINGVLYYSKENRRRQWLFEDADIKACFFRHHIDPVTGEHLTKEFTTERMTSQFYCKNMNETITRLYLSCDVCRSKFYSLPYSSHYGTRSSVKPVTINPDERENSAPFGMYQPDPPPAEYIQQGDSNDSSVSNLKRKVSNMNIPSSPPPVKKARKSTPHKFVPPEQQHTEDSNDLDANQSNTENGLEVTNTENALESIITDNQLCQTETTSLNDDSNGGNDTSSAKNPVDSIPISETNQE